MKQLNLILSLLTLATISFGQSNWSMEFGFGFDNSLENFEYNKQNFEPRVSLTLNKKTKIDWLEVFISGSYDKYSWDFTPSIHPAICWAPYYYKPIEKIIANRLDIGIGQQTRLFKYRNFDFNFNSSVGLVHILSFNKYYHANEELKSESMDYNTLHIRIDLGISSYYQVSRATSVGVKLNYAQFFNEKLESINTYISYDPQKIFMLSIKRRMGKY